MATTLTRNLKLRLDSNLTTNARYNLERLDLLGGTFLTDSTDSLQIRSRTSIVIQPESPDLGGSGTGGSVTLGTASQALDSVTVYSSSFQVAGASGLQLLDQASGGTKSLSLKYVSTLSGSVDTSADRTLSIDLDGANRSLILGGNFQTAGGLISLTTPSNSSLTLPVSGTVSTLAGVETLTNKTIVASANTITGITNSNIAPSSGIEYSKLALSSSIVDSDIAGSAAISGLKISPNFGSQLVQTSGGVRLQGATYGVTLQAAISGQTAPYTVRMPPSAGTAGQFMSTDGSGNLSWSSPTAGSVTAYAATWDDSDGITKTVVHPIGSTDVAVQVIDLDTSTLIGVDSITVVDSTTVQLQASEPPASAWRVIITG